MPLHIFTTSWYLTLFSAEPWPPESTKMIWDRLFCDGCRATLAERRRAASGIEAPCTQCLRHGDPLTLYYACGWGGPAADSSPGGARQGGLEPAASPEAGSPPPPRRLTAAPVVALCVPRLPTPAWDHSSPRLDCDFLPCYHTYDCPQSSN